MHCANNNMNATRGSARLRRQKRKGAAAVEFAVVAPILFLLLLGILEIERGFMVVHGMSAAARQGCRAAIINSVSATAQSVQTAVDNVLTAYGISGYTTTIRVNGAVVSSYSNSSAKSGDDVQVSISVPVSSISFIPHGYLTGNLSGQYTLQKEQIQ